MTIVDVVTHIGRWLVVTGWATPLHKWVARFVSDSGVSCL